jgi:uncharacterized protein (DUF983 family)
MIGFLMYKKGSKLYSIFNNKCPRCQTGNFFISPNYYNFKSILKTHETCGHCHLKYMIEPSFFYGAMYITYALTVTISVFIFGLGYFLGLHLMTNLILISIVLTILSPLNLRLSRLIYINIFVHFDASKAQET